MAENLRLLRLYFVLLAIVTVGRWILGTVGGVPYAKGTNIFSIVTLTLFASIFHAAFARRWLGYGIGRALGLGLTLGFLAELVILIATIASYLLGMDTYFNHPSALNVAAPITLAQALPRRLGGLVVGSIMNGIAAALGWLLGGVLPQRTTSASV